VSSGVYANFSNVPNLDGEILVSAGECPVLTHEIASFPWANPDDVLPKTQFGVSFDGAGVHVAFRIIERFMIARTQEWDGPVYADSCVEFFFMPGSAGPYFNLEINAAGGVKFNRQVARQTDVLRFPASIAPELNVRVSPGELILQESPNEIEWSAAATIPWALLESVGDVARDQWRVNFYKCAEKNSAPHFGSWAPIETPSPDFHRPEFFGGLRFI
jgi:hypothetical protein